jgi:hypothetical protein
MEDADLALAHLNHNSAVLRFAHAVGGRHEEIVLAPAGNRRLEYDRFSE